MSDYSLFDEIFVKGERRLQRTAIRQRFSMPMRGPEHDQPGTLYPAVQKKPSQPGKNPITKKPYPMVPTGKGYDLKEGPRSENFKQKAHNKWLAPVGMTREQGVQNLRDVLKNAGPEHWAAGLPWYDQRNAENKAQAAKTGIHPEIQHAITSALSPNTDWDENRHAADTIVGAAKSLNPKLGHEEKVAALQSKIGGGRGGTGKYMGYPESISKALKLAEYDPDKHGDMMNHIDSVMGGNKTRSFYNNMSDPEKNGNDVTIDKHMINAYLTGMGDDETRRKMRNHYQANQSAIGSPQEDSTEFGLHPMISDAVRQVTDEWNQEHGTNYSPMQMQAVMWHPEKERSDAFAKKLSQETRQRNKNPGMTDPNNTEEIF